MGVTLKCHFSWDSQVKSIEIFEIGTFVILKSHNFLCKPPIEVRVKKIVAFIENFPTICGMPFAHKLTNAILNF